MKAGKIEAEGDADSVGFQIYFFDGLSDFQCLIFILSQVRISLTGNAC
jgi:hypothetical protein